MGHAKIINETVFALETLFITDEDGRPVCVAIVKATFDVGTDGTLTLSEVQRPINPSGVFRGDPAESSYIYEPETALHKPTTDVVLIAHAYAERPGATEVLAGIKVGPVQKIVKVFGDRLLIRRSGVVSISSPKAFDRIPLSYERAFGGWDRRAQDAGRHRVELSNPVGTGFRDPSQDLDDEMRLPNLEDSQRPWRGYGDCPPPAGFGFVSPNWLTRSRFAGTYDETWTKHRSPLLPQDFNRAFFNAASPGLVAPNYLRGDEAVVVRHASAAGVLSFALPGISSPECDFEMRNGGKGTATTQLDTVIVDTDDNCLTLIWRTHFPLRNGPHDLAVLRTRTQTTSYVKTSANAERH